MQINRKIIIAAILFNQLLYTVLLGCSFRIKTLSDVREKVLVSIRFSVNLIFCNEKPL